MRLTVVLTVLALAALSLAPLYSAWVAIRYIAKAVSSGGEFQAGWGTIALVGLVIIGGSGLVSATAILLGRRWGWWTAVAVVALFVPFFSWGGLARGEVDGIYASLLLALPVLAGLVSVAVREHCGVSRSRGGRSTRTSSTAARSRANAARRVRRPPNKGMDQTKRWG